MINDRSLTATAILSLAFLALVSGHLLLKSYMPNPAFAGIGLVLVSIIYYYVLFVRRDTFGFLLVVFVCSYFLYAHNQGGLWNLLTFGMLTIHMVTGQRKEGFSRPDYVMTALLGIFILWNVLGWAAKNPISIVPKMEGVAAFFGFILMFRLSSNIVITKERARRLLLIIAFMILYQLLVQINQRYYILHWNTPLLGGYGETGTLLTYGTTNAWGTLVDFELVAEYAALMVCLLIPLLSSSLTQRELKVGSNLIVVMIFTCLATILLATNRSATILVALAITLYYFVLPMRLFSAVDRVARQFRLVLVLGILLPVIGTYIGLHTLENKFSLISSEKFSVQGVISGKDINRGGLVDMGLDRLGKESWFIGNGFGVIRSNQWAWFGVDPKDSAPSLNDFHSLYLSLPELYGWVGAMAFLSMIVVTWFRSMGAALRNRNRKSYLVVFALGFSMFWFVFLANEYKISILRNPSYHMLFWIWLGLTNSVVKTIRFQNQQEKQERIAAYLADQEQRKAVSK